MRGRDPAPGGGGRAGQVLVTKVAGLEDEETLLTSLQHHLHPNHGLCVQLRTQLIFSYDQLEEKSRAQLSRTLSTPG